MSRNQVVVGLDIGSCYIRTVVAKIKPDSARPQIVGVSQVPSFGLRRGVVVDIDEASKVISQAVQEAERSSGIPIERISVSVSGNHIEAKQSKGVVAVSRADGEISKEDVERAIGAASAISVSPNREIFHVLPRGFTVDNQNSIKDPVGMSGVRLEVDALIVEGSKPFIKNLYKCISEAGLEVENMILSPLAAGRASLNKRQKELGVLVLDLGGGTAGLSIYEEGDVIHSYILPVGCSHITNDIAIGLRSGIDLAEKVKLEYGSATLADINKKDVIDLAKLNMEEKGSVSRSMVVEIIEARLSEILDLTNKELKRVDRQGLLPAGVVLVGGGAKVPGLVDLAKEKLKLPVQIGFPANLDSVAEEVEDPSFATAVGLALWALDNREKRDIKTISGIGTSIDKIKKRLGEFLP